MTPCRLSEGREKGPEAGFAKCNYHSSKEVGAKARYSQVVVQIDVMESDLLRVSFPTMTH